MILLPAGWCYAYGEPQQGTAAIHLLTVPLSSHLSADHGVIAAQIHPINNQGQPVNHAIVIRKAFWRGSRIILRETNRYQHDLLALMSQSKEIS